ncbi:MAG: beta-N-acetylglucosaminidase domain-containing protein [Frankiaceae bacterium]|nr:beta-N-acetylglucosaminidase domain-containing protein [Frankiaceae bacterium]
MTAVSMTAWHGVLEGFYGEPYADAARLDLVRWVGTVGGRDYVYAPKDDPYQRAQWRTPYPPDRMQHFADLVAAGQVAGVRIGFVVSPGLDWQPGDEPALVAKLRAFYDLGARCLGIAFDDVPPGGADLGTVHGNAVAAAVAALPGDVLWAACPVDYGTDRVTAYLGAFVAALPADVDLFWTGPSVLSPDVPVALTTDLSRRLGRRLVFADNFPVSDGPMAGVLHLGPYPQRDPDLPAAVGGLLLNLGPTPVASRLPAAAGLRWWSEPQRDRTEIWEAELAGVPGLASLARACRSWLTEPGPDPELLAWTHAALDGDTRLEDYFAAGCRDGLPAEWAAELEPWLQAWEWHAMAVPIALAALRSWQDGTADGPGGAFTVAEVWRRGLAMERQLFGIRWAFYPVTARTGDAEHADPAGLVRGDTLLDTLCREALGRLTGERP